MGKRKHHYTEDQLARKIKKLERKMHKKRKKHRRKSSSSDSSYSSSSSVTVRSVTPEEVLDEVYVPEYDQEDAIQDNEVVVQPTPDAITPTPDVPALDPNILNLLGEEPEKEESFGPEIQKDLSNRWSGILINGLKDDTKKELLKSYEVPENLKLAQPPTLNAEIKAAVNENVIKRDAILLEKQRLLGCVVTCIADTLTKMLTPTDTNVDNNQHLKTLSDAGRLLCHIHYSETQTRRNFLLACLNKDVKDNIKNSKRDQLLFGTDLPEKLKSMKAITKTGTEIKSTANKTKPNPKNKQTEASTSRSLNWRALPPQPPPPRRATGRMSSTAGGRKQQPARHNQDRPATRHHSGRSHRR